MITPKVYSVTQINRYIRKTIENDFILNSLWVKGEISNFKSNASGHFYFTLKDQNSAISCVMFKGSATLLPFLPENGMSVVVCGYVSIYERTGQYQLYVELMEPTGMGALAIAFEQLKERLASEGLFDEEYKREIPPYTKTIAVITSPTGAAVRDIIQVAGRRNPCVKIVVVPAQVQGEGAADTIVSALRLVNEWGKADVIIVGRGGGSIEDLWAFNEEKVARAIFASEIPVISAVGHEIDFTIADFVADLRAPTPSAAAELAVNDHMRTKEQLRELQKQLQQIMLQRIIEAKGRLDRSIHSRILQHPLELLQNSEIALEQLQEKIVRSVLYKMERKQTSYYNIRERLQTASPLSVLQRGYSVIYTEQGKAVSSIEKLSENMPVTIYLKDGKADAVIMGTKKNGKKEIEF